MKKYFLKIFVFVLSLLAPFLLYAGYIYSLPDGRSRSIASTFRYKTQLLYNTPSPKIILTGGSSSPFGNNCQQIKDGTDTDCICIGATAYIGKGIYLKTLENGAKPGDIIVLGFESSLIEGESTDYTLVWEAAGTDRDVWKNIPFSYYKGMVSSFISYADLRKSSASQRTGETNGSFGPLGDVITYRETLLESGYNKLDMRSLDEKSISYKELDIIKHFAQKMQKKGITVLFAFAPLDRLCVTSTAAETEKYGQLIADYLGLPVVVSLDDAIMEAEYFYDTNNHLTTRGSKIYSDYMISGINRYRQQEAVCTTK